MTAARIGYDSSFGIATDATFATVTALAEVVSITPPGTTRNLVDATHLKSPNKYMEYITGMKDGGDASLELNYTEAESAALFAKLDGDDPEYCEISLPDGSKLQFQGLFTEWSPGDISPDEKMSLSVTVKQTGPLTLVAST